MKTQASTARARAWIQAAAGLALLYAGWELYRYTAWLEGGAAFQPRPPLAEAFLPANALASARLFFLGRGFDPVHPAGLSIFLGAILLALLARRSFCAYLCPLGRLGELLHGLGRRLGLARRPGRLVSRLISLPKYILLALLLWFVFLQASPAGLENFLHGPFNKTADSRLLLFFLHPSRNTLIGLAVILAGSLLVPGFWCRGFCPYGALLGLVSLLSPLAVRRDKSKCTYCRRCARICPVRIPVHEAARVSGPECLGCLQCLGACPEKGCLTLRAGYSGRSKALPAWALPLICLVIMAGVYVGARLGGHWENRIPPEEARLYFQLERAGEPAPAVAPSGASPRPPSG